MGRSSLCSGSKITIWSKISQWQPRPRDIIFFGFNPVYSSNVTLFLNLITGHISPQHHVVLHDDFSTVPSIDLDSNPPSFWNVIDLEENSLRIPLYKDYCIFLASDWLTPVELEERSRSQFFQI